MFGVLLESRARRQRRSGGVALSVATHLAIIAAVTAGTAVGKPAPKPVTRDFVVIPMQPKAPESKPVRTTTRGASGARSSTSTLVIKHIDVPLDIPVGIPKIEITPGVGVDSIVVGGGKGTTGGGLGPRSLVGEDDSASNEWRGSDALMHVVKSATPRYPELLRQSGVDGHVLIRFTVDTLGRIDLHSVQVLSATHELFSRAVRDALSGFRFRPAESNGKRVPALAEMPFEFSVRR